MSGLPNCLKLSYAEEDCESTTPRSHNPILHNRPPIQGTSLRRERCQCQTSLPEDSKEIEFPAVPIRRFSYSTMAWMNTLIQMSQP